MLLTPTVLLSAYSTGIFPMADDSGETGWYDPDPRTILPLDESFHVSHSLARRLRHNEFEIRADTAFREVMLACAKPAPGREQTWISDHFVAAYTRLHHLGFAHSVEIWQDGKLVGGLYGVTLGGLFAGESMFHYQTDASKVALVHLTDRLRTNGFILHDVQFMTGHLRSFGAIQIPREEYKARLALALKVNTKF